MRLSGNLPVEVKSPVLLLLCRGMPFFEIGFSLFSAGRTALRKFIAHFFVVVKLWDVYRKLLSAVFADDPFADFLPTCKAVRRRSAVFAAF